MRRSVAFALLVLASGCARHGSSGPTEERDREGVAERLARAAEPPPEPPRQCTESVDGDEAPLETLEPGDQARTRPLVTTTVDTQVVGTLAHTTLSQVFVNPFSSPIEVHYTLPLHKDAAVHGLQFTVEGRTVEGQVEDENSVRESYDIAREQGRVGVSLVPVRPDVFTERVANIPPGRSVEVQVALVQRVRRTFDRARVVLPTVVGPRFAPSVDVAWASPRPPVRSLLDPPRLPPGLGSCVPWEINVALNPGGRVRGVRSTHHSIRQDLSGGVSPYASDYDSVYTLAQGSATANRDFELMWDVEPGDVTTVVQQNEDGTGAFMLTASLPLDPGPPSPRAFVFVLDTSESMRGRSMETAKAWLRTAIEMLEPEDAFTVLGLSESQPALGPGLLAATEPNQRRGLQYLEAVKGDGGTPMEAGIGKALSLAQRSDRAPTVVLISDGYFAYDQALFRKILAEHDQTRVLSVGVGEAPNRLLLEGAAWMAGGAVDYVHGKEPIGDAVARLFRLDAVPVLKDISIDRGDLPLRSFYPTPVADLSAGEPLVLLGTFSRPARGVVVVRGRQGGESRRFEVELDLEDAFETTGLDAFLARVRAEKFRHCPREDTIAPEPSFCMLTALQEGRRAGVIVADAGYVAVAEGPGQTAASVTVRIPVEPIRGMDAPFSEPDG